MPGGLDHHRCTHSHVGEEKRTHSAHRQGRGESPRTGGSSIAPQRGQNRQLQSPNSRAGRESTNV